MSGQRRWLLGRVIAENESVLGATVVGRRTAGAYGLLILTTFFWGANAVFAKLAVGEISPMVLVSLRWLGVVLVLGPFAIRSVARDWAALRARWPYLMTMGALGLAVFNGIFYWAAHHTSAINIGILQGVMPMFILLGTFGLYRVRISLYQALGVGITMVGVAVVGIEGDLDQLRRVSFNRGDLLVLLACALYAAYTIGLRHRPETGAVN
ncbi:MAG: DMT family transporter, partial [Pseudomonadales bacterium]